MSNACRWTCEPARGGHSVSTGWLPLWQTQDKRGQTTYCLAPMDRAVFPFMQHLQGSVPLIPHMSRAVFPLIPHMSRAVFPLMPPSRRAVFPLCHTLAGPCSPYATHLRDHVPLMPPLAGPCSLYATHWRARVPPMPPSRRAVFPLCHTLVSRIPLMPLTSKVVFPPYATH